VELSRAVSARRRHVNADGAFVALRVDGGDAKTNGIGAMSEARWQDFFQTMVNAGVYPAEMDFKQAFTLQFVNKKVGMAAGAR